MTNISRQMADVTTHRQPEMFGSPPIAGLSYADAILSAEEEAFLIARIDEEPLTPFEYRGWLGNRLTRSFGWTYDFTRGRLASGDPPPPYLLPFRARAAAFADLDSHDLVQALLIKYEPGAGIGWHRDRPAFEDVIGISLGNDQVMRFRRRIQGSFERVNVPLARRSIYLLQGPVRRCWEHSIAPVTAPRWSITFRTLAQGQPPVELDR